MANVIRTLFILDYSAAFNQMKYSTYEQMPPITANLVQRKNTPLTLSSSWETFLPAAI